MTASATSRILLCGAEPSAWDDVRRLLEEAGHSIVNYQLDARDPENLPDYSLVLLQGSGPEELDFCRRLRLQMADSFIPILYLTSESELTSRLDSLEAGVDAYLQRPFAPPELLAQVQALLRIKELHIRLLEKTAEVNLINKRLEAAHKKVDQELELARRIQQSFLPQSMPEMPRAGLAVLYLPCGRVGGDLCGRIVADLLRDARVDVSALTASPHADTSQTLIVNVAGQDRRFIHTFGANALFRASDIPLEQVRRCRVLYLGGYLVMPNIRQAELAKTFAAARKAGVRTVLDVVTPGPADYLSRLEKLLPHVDVFLPNNHESELITGEKHPLHQAEAFRRLGARTVVITMGEGGALLLL